MTAIQRAAGVLTRIDDLREIAHAQDFIAHLRDAGLLSRTNADELLDVARAREDALLADLSSLEAEYARRYRS